MVDSSGVALEAGFPLGAFNPMHCGTQLFEWVAHLWLRDPVHVHPSAAPSGSNAVSWWQQRSLPKVEDLQLALLLALMLPALRWRLECTLFESAAQRALSRKAPVSQRGKERSHLTVVKFKESAWKCCFYGATWLFGLAVTLPEGWLGRNTCMLWEGWPYHTVTSGVKLFYMVELAYYVFGILAVGTSLAAPSRAWEVRRKDSTVMLAHHIATALLLAYSYLNGFVRAGAVVLLVHDLSDVLLEGAKLCKYAGHEGGAAVAFVAFALSFFLLRLVYYPAVLIYSTSFEAPRAVGAVLSGWESKVFYYTFNTSLTLVLVLHAYWFRLITRIVAKQVASGGQVDDVRSDSDDD